MDTKTRSAPKAKAARNVSTAKAKSKAKTKTKPKPKTRAVRIDAPPRGDSRRHAILRALHSCVISKGYSKTTLAEVAEAADMYPSHLLYYFNGKEAILEQYFQDVANKILLRLQSFSSEPPQQQIELLANLFFAGEGIKKSEIGFMLECFGVAVNDGVLREEKAELDRQCKNYLRAMFEQSPKPILEDPRDCAEIAYAMLVGLRSGVYFDEKLSLEDAYRLFHSSVRHMAGFAAAR